MEQMPRAFVQAQDALEIKDEKSYFTGMFQNITHHRLGGGEQQIALQLIDADRARSFAESFAFLRRSDAAGIELRAGEFQTDGGFADDRAAEQVQAEMPRQFLADADAAHAVAERVESRRKN